MSPSKHYTAEKDGKDYALETEGLDVNLLKYIDILGNINTRVQFGADLGAKSVKFAPSFNSLSALCTRFGYVLTGSKLVINMYQDGGIGQESMKTVSVLVAGRTGAALGSAIGTAINPLVGGVIGGFIGGLIASFMMEKVNECYFSVDKTD